MATAEKLLHDAQYAFHSISYGESRDNTRHRRRALALAKKIIRKYPASVEAREAHAILRRLGEEAYVPRMPLAHRHAETVAVTGAPTPALARPERGTRMSTSPDHDTVLLDWGGLASLLRKAPRAVWIAVGFVGFVLFSIFGYFLLVPLLALLLFTGPFRGLLQPQQRREMNGVIIKANAWIDEQLRSG